MVIHLISWLNKMEFVKPIPMTPLSFFLDNSLSNIARAFSFPLGISKLSKYGYGVSIDTKSDLILRDIDLLKEINSKNNVIVKFTITTPKDELSKKIEPPFKFNLRLNE